MTRRATGTPTFPSFHPSGPSYPAEYENPPAQAHSRTSRVAAQHAKRRAPGDRVRVLAFLRRRGNIGATDEEMQLLLELNPSTQRPRRINLVDADLVFDSGWTRRVKSGREATVWLAREGE